MTMLRVTLGELLGRETSLSAAAREQDESDRLWAQRNPSLFTRRDVPEPDAVERALRRAGVALCRLPPVVQRAEPWTLAGRCDPRRVTRCRRGPRRWRCT